MESLEALDVTKFTVGIIATQPHRAVHYSWNCWSF